MSGMMNNGRILVVEDDYDIANMLRIFFAGQGYVVDSVGRGDDALAACRSKLPDLVVLDIMLPDMDGYAVCRELRTHSRTAHIPIIFLTRKDERRDKIAGLELGADDYVTKPFDIEELKWRVRNAISTHQRQNLTDPTTGLPGVRLIEEQLRQLVNRSGWWLILVGIDHYTPFVDHYGFVAAAEVLRFVALLLNRAVDEAGSPDDFLGHTGNDSFVIISYVSDPSAMVKRIHELFQDGIRAHYSFVHSEQGGIDLANGGKAPLMKLSLGIVSDRFYKFSDIREITEAAAVSRRSAPA
jgi:PleD family two-component response regulator